jgi:hypothetical protein
VALFSVPVVAVAFQFADVLGSSGSCVLPVIGKYGFVEDMQEFDR